MIQISELLLGIFLVSCLMLAVSSRLLHCIRIVSLQGIILGILPLTLIAGSGDIHWPMIGINLILKGMLLPYLLYRVMLKAGVKRELEPVIGYSLSGGVVLLMVLFSFFIAGKLSLPVNASAVAGVICGGDDRIVCGDGPQKSSDSGDRFSGF